ncbi:hypothetical protein GGH99_007236, partial [Coemansia sp. RSA 1285]
MSLHEWISDALIDLVGESSSDTVDYVLHLASSCSSEGALVEKLVASDFPKGESTVQFGRNLKGKDIKDEKTQAKDRKTRESRKRNVRQSGWSSNEEERDALEERIKKAKIGTDADEAEGGHVDENDSDTSRQMDNDEEERDAFAERLKQRDKDKTKTIVEDRSSGNDPELQRRRDMANDYDARRQALPEIRSRARQEYLKLREEQRLEL